MKSKRDYFSMALLWLFSPILVGLSLSINTVFGFTVWGGVFVVLIFGWIGTLSNGRTKDREL